MKLALLTLLLATQSPFIETMEVRLHNIDVIVTDAEGKPVEGLTRDDFELLEDGAPQKITNFAAYSENVAMGFSPSHARTEVRATLPARRTIVFFVDEMAVHPRTRARLGKRATEMLDRIMREGDAGMVVRPISKEKVSHAFTSDRGALRDALANAVQDNKWRADVGYEAEHRQFVWEGGTKDAAKRNAHRVRRRVDHRLGYLRGIIAALSPLEGRKVLVLVTESLPAQPGRDFLRRTHSLINDPQWSDVPGDAFADDKVDDRSPSIEELARTASSNGITIYALQPEYDLRVSAPSGEPDPHAHRMVEVSEALENSADALDILTEKTGGTWRVGADSPDDVLRQIESDVRSYYSLAYRAGEATDTPHDVVVRVKNRPELKVRARNEVMRKSPAGEMTDRVVAGLVYANMRNDLGVAARAGESSRGKGRRVWTVDVDVVVPIGRLMLIRDGDVYRGRFTVHYAITGKERDFVSGIEPEQVVEIPAAELDTARAKTWRYTLHMNTEKGVHDVAVGVLDGTSLESGVATLTVDVK